MIEQLQKCFGIDVKEREFNTLKGLPVYLTVNRKLHKLQVDNCEFLVVSILEDDKYRIDALKKQLEKYSLLTGLNVVFSFEEMTCIQRNALIKANIPFIAVPNQIYIPFLGIMLSNRFHRKKNNRVDKMMPVTQQVFLYLTYNKRIDTVTKSAVAEALGVTRTSLTRATNQLMEMHLITEEKKGKEIYIRSVKRGKEMYALAKHLLINPVQQEIYVDESSITSRMLKSGETALGEQTMLNPPKIKELAIYKNSEEIKNIVQIDEKWETSDRIVKIQLWKYNPNIFSNNEYVDPISLLCSFEENVDERIDIQIEEFLEEMTW